MIEEEIRAAERLIGHTFDDPALLVRALTHASGVDSRLQSNERMEFLGDAVLGMVVCGYLFENYDHLLEGEMTKIKSSVVSRETCAVLADEMGLDDLLRLGKGMSNRRKLPRSVIAALYEAVIGAIYLDSGLHPARDFILSGMQKRIEQADRSGHQDNFKSVLQQAVQQHYEQTPQYLILDEKGPDHAKCFEVCVELGARRFDSCWGSSKKQAEQQAAVQALIELDLARRTDSGEIQLTGAAANGEVAE